ncbi:MAG: hypothetical protein AAGF75_12890 [Cyanobacteria bacterium P01_H01_bin.130]
MGFSIERYLPSLAKRFSFVAIGVGISAVILLVVPAVAAGQNPIMGVILTVLLIGWAIAMAAFRSPAIALLRQYAIDTNLSQAMGLLLFAMAMVGAFAGPLQDWLLALGAPTALGGSSALLVASAGLLRSVNPQRSIMEGQHQGQYGGQYGHRPSSETPPELLPSLKTMPWGSVGRVLLLGGAIAWGLRLLFGSLGPSLTAVFPSLEPGLAIFAFALTAAFLAVPAGVINSLWGIRKMMMGGAVMLMLTVTGLQTPLPPNAVIIFLVVSMLAWTVVFNGSIPLAFLALTGDRGGLAVGSYFGGFAGGMALLNWTPLADILETTSSRAGASGIVFAAIAFLVWQLGKSQPQSVPQTPKRGKQPSMGQ